MYLVKNAGRVNPGDKLANVYSQPVDESVKARAELLDKCIEILEKSIVKDNFTAGEASDTSKELQKLYYDLMGAVSSGDASILSSSYADFLVLLNKMNSYSNGNGDIKVILEDYKSQREELASFYKGDFVTETATEGGYFFKDLDGYESIYSSADI